MFQAMRSPPARRCAGSTTRSPFTITFPDAHSSRTCRQLRSGMRSRNAAASVMDGEASNSPRPLLGDPFD